MPIRIRATGLALAAAALFLAACDGGEAAEEAAAARAAAAVQEGTLVAQHLAVFDTLDFAVFSHQQWDRFSESHAGDIIVTWPDGHETQGLAQHIEDVKAMFVYAPDITITEHPIRFGQGEWTAVQGFMAGTFTAPMPIGNGKTIPPTGKAFRLNMATIGHWTNGKMDHEWLFWDGQDFMKQLGLAP